MYRYVLPVVTAVVLVTATLIPDDAEARRGGGGARGGGIHRGSAVHARGFHGGGRGFAGAPRPSHPIAGRPGRPGYPVAGRPGRPVAGYPGGYYRGYGYPYRGYGAAAVGVGVGAAAAGAAYYNNSCYDPYGKWICPGYGN
jgi:hypothetical protein